MRYSTFLALAFCTMLVAHHFCNCFGDAAFKRAWLGTMQRAVLTCFNPLALLKAEQYRPLSRRSSFYCGIYFGRK